MKISYLEVSYGPGTTYFVIGVNGKPRLNYHVTHNPITQSVEDTLVTLKGIEVTPKYLKGILETLKVWAVN